MTRAPSLRPAPPPSDLNPWQLTPGLARLYTPSPPWLHSPLYPLYVAHAQTYTTREWSKKKSSYFLIK